MKISIRIGILIFAMGVTVGGQTAGDLSPIFHKLKGGLPGYEDLPQLMSAAPLACKGEVVFAPRPTFAEGDTPRMMAVASVRLDRCFKGTILTSLVSVLFDGVLPAAGLNWHAFILRTGDCELFFLRPFEGKFILVDQFYGALPVSRKCGADIEDAIGSAIFERCNRPLHHLLMVDKKSESEPPVSSSYIGLNATGSSRGIYYRLIG